MPDQTQLFHHVAAQVKNLEPQLIATRRELHQYPELGWMEFRTASRICARLDELGYAVRAGRAVVSDGGGERYGVPDAELLDAAWEKARAAGASLEWLEPMRGGYTGVIANLNTGRPGPCIAFRFDLDALPINEASDHDHRPAAEGWASSNQGTMHACGHDGHTSIGLSLAQLAVDLLPHLNGRIRFIFQPAEEGVRGAAAMNHACDGVDRLFCLHLGLGIPSGHVVGGAVDFLASKEFRAHIHGRSAHAALAPEAGRSALLAAAQAVLALHTLPQNGKHLVRVNAGILRGGVATNIVPAEAELDYRVRSDDNTAIEELASRARQVVESSAATFGCRAELEVLGQSGSEDSHPALAARVAELAQSVHGVTTTATHHPFGASDDATRFMAQVHQNGGQAAYIMLGSDLSGGHHSERFDFDERSLRVGVELLGRLLVHFQQPAAGDDRA